MKKSLLITTVTLIVPFLFSCSDKEEEIVPVSSIALSESEVTLKVGEEVKVTSTVSPENATERTLVWTSSHPNSVTAVGGLLHAYSVPKDTDKVTITAKDRSESVSASLSVTVLPADPAKPVEADGITISKEAVSLVLDGVSNIATISATVTPLDTLSRDIEWTSSNTDVVTLSDVIQPNPAGTSLEAKKSSKVTLTAGVEGSAKVTAKCGNFSVSCAVTVSPKPDSIQVFAFGQKEVSVEAGETVTNTLTVLPYNALEGKTVTYESSDTDVATVNAQGVVTGVAESVNPVTITAKVDGEKFYDSYSLYVTHRYVNYLHMKRNESSRWVSEDIQLKGGSSTEYQTTSMYFNRNDLLCFCIGRTDWYKYAEVKDGCGQGTNFTYDEDNIKILRSGYYTIYVETADTDQHGIWFQADDLDEQVAKLVYVNGATQESSETPIDPKTVGSTEYKFEREIKAGDYFYVDFGGERYSYSKLKSGGVADKFEEYSTQNGQYIKCKETHTFTAYIETDPTKYDESGKAMYVRADYIMYSVPSAGKWLTIDCEQNFDDGGNPQYFVSNFKLEKGANFIPRINGTYCRYDLLEEGGKKAWTYMSDETDRNTVVRVAGTYDIYCKTQDENGATCTSIYMDGSVDTAKNYAEILRKNQSTPEAKIGLALKPGYLDEFEMENVSLAAGDKIRFYIGDGYELRLKNPIETSKFKAVDSNGYFECKTAGAFDLYIKFKDNDSTQLGLWVADHIVINYVTYTLKDYPSWYMDYTPHFYAWAWPDGGSGKLYEAEVNSSGHIIFTIPDYCVKANFYRCNATYAETVCPGDDDAAVWNKHKEYVLSGHDDDLSPTLFGS